MEMVKGVDLTGLLGGHKRRLRVWGSPSGVQGRSPGKRSGGLRTPGPEAEAFCETTHNIYIKIQQTTVVAVTR